jgi:hypothetical protein
LLVAALVPELGGDPSQKLRPIKINQSQTSFIWLVTRPASTLAVLTLVRTSSTLIKDSFHFDKSFELVLEKKKTFIVIYTMWVLLF